jgi:hypothetical protein
VTLIATPARGFTFQYYTGDLVTSTNPLTLTMSQSYNLTAVFAPIGPPTVTINNPPIQGLITGLVSQAFSGPVTISGWALDNATGLGFGISSVEIRANGVSLGNATYGLARPDVCAQYVGRTGCPNVGFTFTFDTSNPALTPGLNQITAIATASDNAQDVGSTSILITVALPGTGTRPGVYWGSASTTRQFILDTNGDGAQDPGDRMVSFALPGGFQTGDIPVSGDWTGDGHTKVGFYRSSTGEWFLDANNNGIYDAGDYDYHFGGLQGDVPVVGDWNGVPGISAHKDCVGIFRSGFFWVLDLNCNGSFDDVPTDAAFPFGGLAGDVPVVGKWKGGFTRVGVVRKYAPQGVPIGNPFFWLPDNADPNAGTSPAVHQPNPPDCFAFGGLAGDIFLTGDWYGTGKSYPAVYRNGLWVLDAATSGDLQANHTVKWTMYYGYSNYPPVAGKW